MFGDPVIDSVIVGLFSMAIAAIWLLEKTKPKKKLTDQERKLQYESDQGCIFIGLICGLFVGGLFYSGYTEGWFGELEEKYQAWQQAAPVQWPNDPQEENWFDW
ncbi:hypothetical protein JNK13_03065 [bacterium]|nr:hypothetical protein [bacterium]